MTKHKVFAWILFPPVVLLSLAGCGASEEEKAQAEAEAQRQEVISHYQEMLDNDICVCEWEKNIITEVNETNFFEEQAANPQSLYASAEEIYQKHVDHYTGALEWLTGQKESASSMTLGEAQKAIEILADRPGNEHVCTGVVPQYEDTYKRLGLEFENKQECIDNRKPDDKDWFRLSEK
ncbi:MAG: hypothetical protein IKZ87_09255 [Actinomycetaceae bacterium]|nr:hypothetical protein [Actinomycetaceae bacterium]